MHHSPPQMLNSYLIKGEAKFVIVSTSEPQSQYIAKQNGSAKETVSPKIGENIEMLICFICTRHKTGLLLISIIVLELQ